MLQAHKERVEASGSLGGESSSKRARKEMEGEGAVEEEDMDVKQAREEGGHGNAFSDLGLDEGAMIVEIPSDAEEQHEAEEKGEEEKGLIFHFI